MIRILPTTLQRYVLREFAKAFALAGMACLMIILLALFFMKIMEFRDFGITAGQVALLAPYFAPQALAYGIPLATMIAAIIVFGRLSAENEILAAQSGGAALRHLALPLVGCGLLLSGVSLWCNNWGLSWSYQTLRDEIIQVDKLEFFQNLEKPGTSLALNSDGGVVVRINFLPYETDAAGTVRRPIQIAYFQNDNVGMTVLAKDYNAEYIKPPAPASASDAPEQSASLVLTLREAQVLGEQPFFIYELNHVIPLPRVSSLLRFGEKSGQKGWQDNLDQAEKIKETFPARRKFMLQRAADLGALNVAQSPGDPLAPALACCAWFDARMAADQVAGASQRAHSAYAEFHRKLALSLLPLSLAVLGLGLGLLVQKSDRLIGFLLGLLVYAFLYYPLMIVSKELAIFNKIGVWSAFVPNAVLLLIGTGLCYFHERGWLGGGNTLGGPSWLARVLTGGPALAWLVLRLIASPFARLRDLAVSVLRYKIGVFVAGSFLAPLLVLMLVIAGVMTAFDFIEHGAEIIDGVRRADEPLGTLQKRDQLTAILDVVKYYGIFMAEWVCQTLPLLILLAGGFCVFSLARNNEHLILKSSGIPLQRAFRPMLFLALLVSIGVTALRERIMPDLLMQRDNLTPLVYHRHPPPTALALHTRDAENKPVLFEMSRYDSTIAEGKNLRIYLLSEERNGRIPVLVADSAKWENNAWRLRREAQAPDPSAGPSTSHKKQRATHAADWGYLLRAEVDLTAHPALNPIPVSAPGAAVTPAPDAFYSELRPVRVTQTPWKEWRGAVTPTLLKSERLGSNMLSLDQLLAASIVKPELKVEWWRRISEFVMGLFLLWVAIPLLLREESGSPLWGVAFSILLAGAYWGLNLGVAELARQNSLPPWAPLLPHALFFIIGIVQYHIRMET